MQTIHLQTSANQTLQVILEGQNLSLRFYSRPLSDGIDRLYCDMALEQQAICRGCPCLDGVCMPLYDYLGLAGKLLFVDMEGDADPHWSGLGSRWRLIYLTPEESTAYKRGTI